MRPRGSSICRAVRVKPVKTETYLSNLLLPPSNDATFRLDGLQFIFQTPQDKISKNPVSRDTGPADLRDEDFRLLGVLTHRMPGRHVTLKSL